MVRFCSPSSTTPTLAQQSQKIVWQVWQKLIATGNDTTWPTPCSPYGRMRMTNKTTMPEPFTFFHGYRTQDLNGNKDDKPPMPYVGLLLFTTDQAEAYKDACVREALEEAANMC